MNYPKREPHDITMHPLLRAMLSIEAALLKTAKFEKGEKKSLTLVISKLVRLRHVACNAERYKSSEAARLTMAKFE